MENQDSKMADVMLKSIPMDRGIGNATLQEDVKRRVKAALDYEMCNQDYWNVRQILIDKNIIKTGRGRGGSVKRIDTQKSSKPSQRYNVYTNGDIFEIRHGKSDEVVDTYKSVMDALKETKKLNEKIV